MPVTVEPLHELFGARLCGFDLSTPLDPGRLKEIRHHLSHYQVLVFPDQLFERQSFGRFAKLFGEPEIFKLPGFVIPPDPDDGASVQRLTNLSEDGVPLGPCPQTQMMSITENWHTDSSYRIVPTFVTILYSVEVPAEGGDTEFASLHVAYDALAPELRATLQSRAAVHSWEFQRRLIPGAAPMSEEERQVAPPVVHPLLQRHPDTGRKLVYTSASAEWIEGLPYEEGRALLDEMMRITTRREVVYAHKYRPGDLVIWDNRAAVHRAGPFDYQSHTLRRLLLRMVIAGDPAAYADHKVLTHNARRALA